ncbi:hypothetical protein PYW07_006702 [Mythimna separata]|uniref:Regulatory protein zeste n=1 Tax=Mythimna separata TaxID=271217 RepID=A0AAD8DXQ8_MYTSE|nr:hypothetical protein PYW07_006702 [Mythimna separata]
MILEMEGRRVPSRVSEAQWGILMEFLESHPNLARARGYNNSARGRAEALRLWQKVANLLNAEGSGTTKSAKEWSVSISNYKSKLKKIVADINTDAHATGGGPPRAINLTDTDTRFLALLVPGFGQTAPQVRVQPFPDEQPSTSSAAESMVFVVEAVAQSQDGVVVAEEPIGVPVKQRMLRREFLLRRNSILLHGSLLRHHHPWTTNHICLDGADKDDNALDLWLR